MAHQLVRAGARDAFDQEHVDRVLQHRAVSLLLDVLEILRGGALDRVMLAHVAQPARVFGELLAVARFALPLHRQMRRLDELRAGEQRDVGDSEYFHAGVRCEVSGVGRDSSSFGVPHAAVRSTSRSRLAMSSGMAAASGPTLSAARGGQAVAGMITPGLRMDSGSYARFTRPKRSITSAP